MSYQIIYNLWSIEYLNFKKVADQMADKLFSHNLTQVMLEYFEKESKINSNITYSKFSDFVTKIGSEYKNISKLQIAIGPNDNIFIDTALPPNLINLKFDNCKINMIPDLDNTKLEILTIISCTKLEHIGKLPDTLRGLGIIDKNLIKEIDLPSNLKYFRFDWRKETTKLKLPESLIELDVSFSECNDLDLRHLHKLKTLGIYNSNVETLENLPTSLMDITFGDYGNTLKKIILPPFIKKFKCRNSNLEEINLPSTLEQLDIRDNKIKHLHIYTDIKHLTRLDLGGNLISDTSFLTKLPCLDFLNLHNNNIDYINYLPSTLRMMDCSNNRLTKLNCLPDNLDKLYCGNNLISILELSPNLRILYCLNNQLTNLNVPNSLRILVCNNNKITKFWAFPAGINKVIISDNPITGLPKTFEESNHRLLCVFEHNVPDDALNAEQLSFTRKIGHYFEHSFMRFDDECIDDKPRMEMVYSSRSNQPGGGFGGFGGGFAGGFAGGF
jgi:Leucine-rich repeat (LRR) protein